MLMWMCANYVFTLMRGGGGGAPLQRAADVAALPAAPMQAQPQPQGPYYYPPGAAYGPGPGPAGPAQFAYPAPFGAQPAQLTYYASTQAPR